MNNRKDSIDKSNREKLFELKNNVQVSHRTKQINIDLVVSELDTLCEEIKQVGDILSSPRNNHEIHNEEINHMKDHDQTLSLNFKQMGVGGHDTELETIIREIFLLRELKKKFPNAYGYHSSPGFILYGLPGTGKTLIAKKISECFKDCVCQVVDGPELKNKYFGQSEEFLRNVFAEAKYEWETKGKLGLPCKQYIIIFDEIDSLFPKRGQHLNSTAEDSMVSTFLTLLQGVDSPQNIIVIGTTNRIDLIDDAIKRPGRLNPCIEIGLPNEKARLEILEIHTKNTAKNGLLDQSVDLAYWAKETKNYTGAELEDLTSKAEKFANINNFDISKETGELTIKKELTEMKQLAKVTHDHFQQAFNVIHPVVGFDKTFERFKKEKFVIYNDAIKNMLDEFSGNIINCPRLLITGQSGAGKSFLSMALAQLANAECVKIIKRNDLIGHTFFEQIDLIKQSFESALHADFSVIILEELEGLIDADAECRSYNNELRILLQSLIKELDESGKKCIVIASATNIDFIKRLGFGGIFNEYYHINNIHLKNINSEDTIFTLNSLARAMGFEIKTDGKKTGDDKEINLPIRELRYQIKKYCASHQNCLDINDFYNFLMLTKPVLENELSMPYFKKLSFFQNCEQNNSIHELPLNMTNK